MLNNKNLFCLNFRKKDIKLNLDLSKVPQGNNLSQSISNKSSPVSSLSTSTNFTTTTITSPLPGNQIRR